MDLRANISSLGHKIHDAHQILASNQVPAHIRARLKREWTPISFHRYAPNDDTSLLTSLKRINASFPFAVASSGGLWLLLGGANAPSREQGATRRRDQVQGALSLVADIHHMQTYIEQLQGQEVWGVLLDSRVTKVAILDALSRFGEACRNAGRTPCVYYTGHGVLGAGDRAGVTGNWATTTPGADGTVSRREVQQALFGVGNPVGKCVLVLDCCYAGQWAWDAARENTREFVYAACRPDEVAVDTIDGGGAFTCELTTGVRPNVPNPATPCSSF